MNREALPCHTHTKAKKLAREKEGPERERAKIACCSDCGQPNYRGSKYNQSTKRAQPQPLSLLSRLVYGFEGLDIYFVADVVDIVLYGVRMLSSNECEGRGRGFVQHFSFSLLHVTLFFVFEGRCLVLRILRGALGDRVEEKGV